MLLNMRLYCPNRMLCCCLSKSLREQRNFNKKKLNLEKEVSIAEIVRQLRVLTAAA